MLPLGAFIKRRLAQIVFFAVLLVYAGNELSFINIEDRAFDEAYHLRYGINILKGDPHKESCTLFDSKMPVSTLNALPRAIQQITNKTLQKNDYGKSDVMMGRYVTFFISLLTLLLVYKWSQELYENKWAGIFSMTLLAFCPGWLAHSGLVTTDAYAASILVLVLYALWKYFRTANTLYFALFVGFVGFSLLVKQTFVYIYLLIPILFILRSVIENKKITLRKTIWQGLVLALVSLFIINLGFLFYKTGQPLNQYEFVSTGFTLLQTKLAFIGNWFFPFPEPFLVGMDTVSFSNDMGCGMPVSSCPLVSILGYHAPGESYWFYYLASFLFKTPIPTILFVLTAGILSITARHRFWQQEYMLIVAFLFFLFVISFFNNLQMGIRHMIFILPLAYILCGKLVLYLTNKKLKIVFATLLVWLAISVFAFANGYLSYTNEFVTDKKNAYKIVGASNLGYGYLDRRLTKYLEKHPDVKLAPDAPAKGKFLISVGDYENNFGSNGYGWLRQYEPIDYYHSYLLIEVR